MLRSRRTFYTAAIAFIAAASMSLIACGDSSEPTKANSAEVDPIEVDQSMFETPCTAENEGKVDSIEFRTGMYGSGNEYYRCESGSWVKRESWIRCAKDAQEGDACIYSHIDGSLRKFNEIYTYTSNGGWELYGGEHDLGKFTVRTDEGRETAYYKYMMGSWLEIDELQYSCFSKYDVQDTCVLETEEGKNYYLTTIAARIEHLPVWIKIDYDPELGFCSFNDEQKYGEKDGKHYYCSQGLTNISTEINPKWVEVE